MYTISDAPMTWRQARVVAVASLGQFVGTAVATVVGVIIPMLNLLGRSPLPSLTQGVLGAADLVGIMVGAVVLGRLSDRFGYLFFFRLCPSLMTLAAAVAALVPSVWVLGVALFVIGFAIGGEYSLDSDYISELMPAGYRSVMTGLAKAASALGTILGAALSLLLIDITPSPMMWPRLMWIIAGIGVVMILSRLRFWESPKWLMAHGRRVEAIYALHRFLGDDVAPDTDPSASSTPSPHPSVKPSTELSSPAVSSSSASPSAPAAASAAKGGFIRTHWHRVVLTGVPWACEGLGVYGFGVFLPILIMALGLTGGSDHTVGMAHVEESVRITMWISCIILPGFLAGVWCIRRRWSVTGMQTVGFLCCALSLGVLAAAYVWHWPVWISITAFMLFELFLSFGPHLVTYVLPQRVYAVSDRGRGTGIAASLGKAGAVGGVMIIPWMLDAFGVFTVMAVSVGVMTLGAAVTFSFRKYNQIHS